MYVVVGDEKVAKQKKKFILTFSLMLSEWKTIIFVIPSNCCGRVLIKLQIPSRIDVFRLILIYLFIRNSAVFISYYYTGVYALHFVRILAVIVKFMTNRLIFDAFNCIQYAIMFS